MLRDHRLARWAVVLASLVSACGSPAPAPTAAPAATPAPAESQPAAGFNPANFTRPTQVDNPWLALTPGRRFVYEGTTVEDDGTVVPHRVEIHVTDLTKIIAGVRSIVTWDLDFSDDELVEAELAFFAQDDAGNVWRMGEYPEEYEAGKFVAAPAWIHGFQQAQAGIMMLADPRPGTPSYAEGLGPAVGWTDRGRVDQVGQQTCVPVDCYTDVLVIAETSASEPGAEQLKYYARGVGNVRVGWRGGDMTQESLEAVLIETLSGAALARVRASALALEQHAYAVSPEVYAQTPPAEFPPGTPAHVIVPAATSTPGAPASAAAEVIVYAADLSEAELFELGFVADAASPGGKLIDLPNTGDELDPPPESDPHATFPITVQAGLPYRCWIHMKVGEPLGISQANVMWVQFTNALDQAGQEYLNVGTSSYLTAEGPAIPGWAWVECDMRESDQEPLVYFRTSGEVTVRLQAGAEGVGFDQFVLSPARFLDQAPSDPIVEK